MRFLIPVDGSALSLEAVRHVLHLAEAGLEIDLLLANVQEPASLYELVVAHDPAVIDEVSEGAALHTLAPAISLVESAGLPFEAVVARGDPGHALVELIERHHCDAVVMGAHGKGMVRQALLGSVTMEMLHAAPVPVTLVKPSEDTALDSDFETTEDTTDDGAS
jgi:nucleotide-binding universal stress UspA family protein